MKRWRKFERQGLSAYDVATKASEPWPDSRTMLCYIYGRRHRTAFVALAKALIKRGIVIDYTYRGQKEMAGETGRADAEARGELMFKDRTIEIPTDIWEKITDKYPDLWWGDCYDDERIYPKENPKFKGEWPPTKPIPYKKLIKGLKAKGWTAIREGKGSHDIWAAPNGIHISIPRRKGNEPIGQPFLREIAQAEAGVIHERSRGRRRNPKPPGIGARVAYKTAGLADTALGAYEEVTSAIGETAHEALRDVQADTGVKPKKKKPNPDKKLRKAKSRASAERQRHTEALHNFSREPGWLYHSTLEFRLPDIRKGGLDPDAEAGMSPPEFGYEEHSRGGLFLSDAAGVEYWLNMIYGGAWVWAEKGVKVGKPMLLRVPERKCPIDKPGTQDAKTYLGRNTTSYRCVTSIPPSEIEIYDTATKQWLPLLAANPRRRPKRAPRKKPTAKKVSGVRSLVARALR